MNEQKEKKLMFEEKYVRVNGVKIRYFDEGKGKVVILIHGLGGASVNWFKNIKSLLKNYRVIVPDLPSFGKSEIPEVDLDDVNYDFLTKFLKDFLDLLKIKKTSLVGNSMGGAIAVNFAFKYPKNTEKLVIVNGAGLGAQISFFRPTIYPIINRIFFYMLTKEFIVRRLIKIVVYDPETLDEASIHAYIEWLKKPKVIEIIIRIIPKAVGIEGQKWLFVGDLKRLSLPTLIVWGKNDRILPLKHGVRAHELIKRSELVVFDRCGHIPQIEKPRKFNKILLEFLGEKGELNGN